MRKTARVMTPDCDVVRVMVYDGDAGVYVFLYDRHEDAPCSADHWFETLAGAEAFCKHKFGITNDDWDFIPDPEPECQHDWIRPTRIKRDAKGNSLWGQFETVDDASRQSDALPEKRGGRRD